MAGRWLPILAAALGLLSGIAGAWVGATKANEGQDKRVKIERAGAIQDLLLRTYGDYLRTIEGVVARVEVSEDQQLREEDYVLVKSAEANVVLLAGPEVREAASDLTNTLKSQYGSFDDFLGVYTPARDRFIDEVHNEITSVQVQ